MLSNLGWMELVMILLIGLLVVGPDQLPKLAGELGRMIRQLRRMATDVSSDLRSELGPEFDDVDLASLHPRRFIEKHLMADDDDEPDDGARRPRRTSHKSASTGNSTGDSTGNSTGDSTGDSTGESTGNSTGDSTGDSTGGSTDPAEAARQATAAVSDVVPPYDVDAT